MKFESNIDDAVRELVETSDLHYYRDMLINVMYRYVDHDFFKGMTPNDRSGAIFFMYSLAELMNQSDEEMTAQLPEFLRIHDNHPFYRKVLQECLVAWISLGEEWEACRLTENFSASGEVDAFNNLIALFN